MTTSYRAEKPVAVRFVDAGPGVLLELTNTTDQALVRVEILTVFRASRLFPGIAPAEE